MSKVLGLGEDTYGYELSGGQGTVIALWTTAKKQGVLIPGKGTAKTRDLTGRELEVSSEKGAFGVSASPSPIFVYHTE